MNKNRRPQASKRQRDNARYVPQIDYTKAQQNYEDLLAEFEEVLYDDFAGH